MLSLGRVVAKFRLGQEGTGWAEAVGGTWGEGDREQLPVIPQASGCGELRLGEGEPEVLLGYQLVSWWRHGFYITEQPQAAWGI